VSIFSQNHLNFLKSVKRHGVKFLIIGGQAAIYHGIRRNTGDLDLLIEPTKENGTRLLKALKELNLIIDTIKPDDFEQQLFLSLGFEPDAVDILTLTPGVDFNSAFERSIVIEDSSVKLNIISLDDLLKNKESMNREGEKKLMDEYDAAVLKKIKQKRDT
jgi:hypothetical protein